MHTYIHDHIWTLVLPYLPESTELIQIQALTITAIPLLALDHSSPSRYLRFLQRIRVHTCWVSWIWHRPDSWFCLWIPSLQTFTAKAHTDAHNTQEHE